MIRERFATLLERHKEDLYRLMLRIAGGIGFLGQGTVFRYADASPFLAAGFLVSGAFILLGVLTRSTAAVSLFVLTQFAVRLNGWADLIYIPLFLCILASGPGRYSFDERFFDDR